MNRTWTVLLASASLVGFTPGASAQERAPQPLVITAQNLMAGDDDHVALVARGGDADAVLPGDVVEYRLVFTNHTDQAAHNVQFTDPLPEGLEYVGGSAAAETSEVVVEFSADGGASYSTRPMIEVMVDGVMETRPAGPERYTHISWTVRGAVASGTSVAARFQARRVPTDRGEGVRRQPGP